RLEMRPDVHASRVEPDKERLLVAIGAVDEIDRRLEEFRVDRLHALARERPGVLAFLFAPRTEARIVARRVGRGGDAFEDAARPKICAERRVLRIVLVLGLLLGVEVIKIAEELVETVHCRQEFVAVAEMILAELAGGITLRLEQFGDGRILIGEALLRAR